jgi:LuxR family transcriptional regulator, maltose regulon positive regulatory protein
MADPLVQGDRLEAGGGVIAVGEPEWFAWLDQAERFRYAGPGGSFGARRERSQRGGWYWKAYRRVAGRLRRHYLGKSAELTSARLAQAAVALASSAAASAPEPDTPGESDVGSTLLVTKLSPPAGRRTLIPRMALDHQIDAALDHRLMVVIAPAGWGKTTLLSAWVAGAAERWGTEAPRIAWVSLDPTDNDPSRLWSYVCAALGAHEPTILTIEPTFRTPRPYTTEQLMTVLINALAARQIPGKRPLLLVLDDFHLITDPQIVEALAFLIDHMPPLLHLVLAGRGEPPLPLARWRAAGQVAELRTADLRFGLRDSADLLAGMVGRALPPESVQALVDRTEGWAAGLHLAGLALRASDTAGARPLIDQISGSHPYILAYLVDEVVRQQEPAIQEFLLRTSILDRLSGGLCDALVAESADDAPPAPLRRSADILDRLERDNLLLVPLDGERRWFRYHQLFADALRALLQRTRPELVRALHMRAAAWYERAATAEGLDMLAAAIGHAIAAADFEHAAQLIERCADEVIWRRGEVQTLLRWLDALPDTVRQAHIGLGLSEAWVLLATIQFTRLRERIDQLEAALVGQENRPARGEIAALRSYLLRITGDLEQSQELGALALELLAPEQHMQRYLLGLNLLNIVLDHGNLAAAREIYEDLIEHAARLSDQTVMMSIASSQIIAADLLLRDARAAEAERIIRHALERASRLSVSAISPTGMVRVQLAEICYERDAIDEAEEHARDAIATGHLWWNYDVLHQAHYQLARVLRVRGDHAGAAAEHARVRELVRSYQVPFINESILVGEGYDALEQGDPAKARAMLVERNLPPLQRCGPTRYDEYMLLARVELAEGRAAEALPILAWLLQIAEAGAYPRRIMTIQILTAIALHATGQPSQGRALLAPALRRAMEGGMLRTILDEGEPVRWALASSLRAWVASGEHADLQRFTRQLLARFTRTGGPPPEQNLIRSLGALDLIGSPRDMEQEPLTPREREILALVAEGASNQAIADRLTVSLHTVKKHLTHILAKLDATSRTAAIAQARARGMLG